MKEFKIATTETYDPSLCINAWIGSVQHYDFVLYITKVLNPKVIEILTDSSSHLAYMNKPSTVHLTVTGWGGTFMEPNVDYPEVMKDKVVQLINAGFPIERLVWRVDPIVPTKEGIERFKKSVDLGLSAGIHTFRSSVLQCYKHVYERLKETPIKEEIDNLYKGNFWPDKELMFSVYADIRDFSQGICVQHPDVSFESCATSQLCSIAKFKNFACMSEADLVSNKIDINVASGMRKGLQRSGCDCLMKHQLIPGGFSKGRCPNKCLYCYIKDKTDERELNRLF